VGGATMVLFSYRWRTVCKSSIHLKQGSLPEEMSQTWLTNKKQGKIRLRDALTVTLSSYATYVSINRKKYFYFNLYENQSGTSKINTTSLDVPYLDIDL
jgi:hypothetical protein